MEALLTSSIALIMFAIYGAGIFAVIYFAVRLAMRHERERLERLGK
jgi:hypothetical protein